MEERITMQFRIYSHNIARMRTPTLRSRLQGLAVMTLGTEVLVAVEAVREVEALRVRSEST